MTDLHEGAYELTDPKHPTFAKRYKDYLKANNSQHSSLALQGFIKNGGRPTPHGQNEEYDVESMLEYIEELESQLDEYSTFDKDAVGKAKQSFKKDKITGAVDRANARFSKLGIPYEPAEKKSYAHPSYNASALKSMFSGKESIEEFGNPIIEMIDSLISGELTESNALFYDLIQYKINEKIELKKLDVAAGIFGESKDEDEDDDNKSDEVGEEEENKHPLTQLKKIASSEEGIPLKYPEVTASGEPDKRSIRAATDRIKSGKSTSGIPTFKHKNGEESVVSPEHAQHLVNVLTGSGLKPDTKKSVMDHIHGSKAGLEKVSSVLGAHSVKDKSIYKDDART